MKTSNNRALSLTTELVVQRDSIRGTFLNIIIAIKFKKITIGCGIEIKRSIDSMVPCN